MSLGTSDHRQLNDGIDAPVGLAKIGSRRRHINFDLAAAQRSSDG